MTLALGVGANSALFTVAAAYVLLSLPAQAGSIVMVENERGGQPGMVSAISYPEDSQ